MDYRFAKTVRYQNHPVVLYFYIESLVLWASNFTSCCAMDNVTYA